MRITETTKLRDYYCSVYPSDELGVEIDETATFYDLFDALDRYRDVYDVIGVGDSVIRERLFDALSKLMDVSYKEVYDQWLMGE